MKKSIFTNKTPALLFLIFTLPVLILSCSGEKKNELKETGNIEFTFLNVKQGDTLSNPLPVKIKGKIKNFTDIENRDKLRLYLVEQSTREKIWHIEPRGKISKEGEWSALTWLGSKRHGNKNTFNLCVFVTEEELRLNNGDHPVKKRPDSVASKCIQLKRRD